MHDLKILVTGLTGQVARPVAPDLAQRNEVWGIARFSKPELREQLEAGGVRCETLDLEQGDFSSLPTDFDVVRAVPFEGECPVNFDGQEVIYEFGAPSGVERIASCETAIDPDHPLFAGVAAALSSVGAAAPS